MLGAAEKGSYTKQHIVIRMSTGAASKGMYNARLLLSSITLNSIWKYSDAGVAYDFYIWIK
jgi:hypothetical protein